MSLWMGHGHEGEMGSGAILLISEQSDIVEQVRQRLSDGDERAQGWVCVAVEDTTAALRQLAQSRFDLVVYYLPNAHAADGLVRLRRYEATMPIVLLWSSLLQNVPVRVLEAEVAASVRWPDQGEQLGARLSEIRDMQRVQRRVLDVELELAHVRPELERRSLVITTLYGVGRALANVVDEAPLFEAVAEAAQHLAVADEGTVMLRENGSGPLALRAKRTACQSHGAPSALVVGSPDGRLRIEDSLAEMVLQTGQSLLIADMSTRSEQSARYVHSLLDVPLKMGDQIVGVISVVNKTTARSFTEDDSLVLAILADYASVALENAWLYQQSKQGAEADIFRQTVATLSHHINNPLATMLAALHMLQTELTQAIPGAPSAPDRRALQTLRAIESKADEIASVVAVLQEVMVPTSTAYWKGERMIDIENELRRRLSALARQP